MAGNKWMLLADKDSKSYDFAEKIRYYIKDEYDDDVALRHLEFEEFRNEELLPYVPSNLRKKDIYFVHDSNKDPQRWWVELLLVKDLLLNSSAEKVTLVLPDMRYSRQDRKDRPHVPVSARALANSISSNTERIITMDLHAAQIQGFYPANVPLDNLYSFPAVVKHLQENHRERLEDLVVCSPDVGGASRARAFSSRLGKETGGKTYPFALIYKTREKPGEIEEMKFIGDDVEGKNVILVDDMIDSGGTLVEAGKLLREKGAKELICYGAHGLFTKGIDDLAEIYDFVMASNSHMIEHEKIETVDVSPLFAEAIYRAQNGRSISKLFE